MQNTFSQSGNDSKWFLKKYFSEYVNGTQDPPPFMEKSILNFHFDCLHPSPMHSDVPGYRYDGDKENMNYWHPLFMSFKHINLMSYTSYTRFVLIIWFQLVISLQIQYFMTGQILTLLDIHDKCSIFTKNKKVNINIHLFHQNGHLLFW